MMIGLQERKEKRMPDKAEISRMTTYLFDCDFFADDFDPEEHEDHLKCAENLLGTYSWSDIIPSWNAFLRSRCSTPEEVINFCNLFFYYGGTDQFIPDPYDFLGHIYYMVDTEKYWEEAGEFLDGFCINVLEKAGEISTVKDPYYQSWKDPKIISAVERYRNPK